MLCYLTHYIRVIVCVKVKYPFSTITPFYCYLLNINSMETVMFVVVMLLSWALAILLCKWFSDGDV